MTDRIKNYAILYLDEHGNVIQWNDEAEKIKGYHPEEIIGSNSEKFYSDEDRAKKVPAYLLEKAVKNGVAVYEGWRIRKDNSAFWGEIVISALYDKDGKVMGFSEVIRDLSENQLQAEFEKSNLDALINNTTDLMWSIDSNRKLITSNKAFDEAVRLVAGKIIEKGESAADLGVRKELINTYEKYFDRVLSGESFTVKEYTEEVDAWAEISFNPIRKGENIIGAACHAHDITDNVRAQLTIQNSEHRFRSLIEHSADAVIILSAELKSLYVSPSLKTVLGYTDEEGMNMDLFPLVHPDDVPLMQEMIEKVLAYPGLSIEGYTCQVKHKNGSWRWMEGSMTNMLHDPVVNGLVDNFRDITERKIAEEKMIRATHLYAFISQVNQAIVHAGSRPALFKEVCRIAVEHGGFMAAWIGMIDKEAKTISMVEHAGFSPEFAAFFASNPYMENGLTDYILKTGKHCVINDLADDRNRSGLQALNAASGFCSCIMLPIRVSGEIIGAFTMHAADWDHFDDAEIALLKEVTEDISFALGVMEKDKAREIAEAKLKHKEFRLNQAQSVAHVGSWELDFKTGIGVWSSEACRIYGHPNPVIEQSFMVWLSFVHPDDLELVKKITKEAEQMLSSFIRQKVAGVFFAPLEMSGDKDAAYKVPSNTLTSPLLANVARNTFTILNTRTLNTTTTRHVMAAFRPDRAVINAEIFSDGFIQILFST